ERFQDRTMLGVGLVERASLRETVQPEEVELLDHASVEEGEPRVARIFDEQVVEAQIEIVVFGDATTLDEAFHLGDERFQRRALFLVEPASQVAAHFILERRTDAVELQRILAGDPPDERAAVARKGDDPLLAKRLQRFAQRSAARAKARRQRRLVKTFAAL